MTKLLHTADLHLDSPLATLALRNEALRAEVENATRAALDRIVDIAIEEGVAALLIAGDLYDGGQRSMKTAAFLLAALRRLETANIRVFVIRGNHDAEARITKEIGWPGNVHVFDGRGGHVMLTEGIAIHGVSFRDAHAPDSLLPRYRPVDGVVNIAMLHTSLGGAAGHDPYAPCSVADLGAAGFDYWALGHIHKRQVHATAPWIVMPGMPQGRDMGEDGPKSATLIHVEPDGIRIEERSTAALTFRREVLDISGAGDIAEVQERIAAHVRGLAEQTPSVLRLTLVGATPLAWHIRRDQDLLQAVVQEAAESTGAIWIDRLDVAVETGETGPSDTALAEVAAMIAEAADAPGAAENAAAILDEILSDLPQELRDDWGDSPEDRARAAQTLLAEAAEWATATMHGPEGA